MKSITEKDKEEVKWYADAKNQTLSTLPSFINHLLVDYEHDYGTICKAIAAAMLGAGYAVNNSNQGGITGFQAGSVMWEFIKEWSYSNNSCGLKILDYDNMLYPQYNNMFDKTISANTFKALQEMAKKNLLERNKEHIHPDVLNHWKSIADGKIPFGYTIKD